MAPLVFSPQGVQKLVEISWLTSHLALEKSTLEYKPDSSGALCRFVRTAPRIELLPAQQVSPLPSPRQLAAFLRLSGFPTGIYIRLRSDHSGGKWSNLLELTS